MDPEDFISEVIDEFDVLTTVSASSSSDSSNSDANSGSSSAGSATTTTTTPTTSTGDGGGFPWGWVLVPGAVGGGAWYFWRKRKNDDDEDLEFVEEIRTKVQTELDELANDVLVLSEPVDLSANQQAITHYREATDTYLGTPDPTNCLLYTSPSPRDATLSRMPSSA